VSKDLLIFIPTYNEHENVGRIIEQIEALNLDADLLFMDDNSPDGTGRLLDELATTRPRLTVMHRSGKLGIGSAHAEGINWAYAQGYRRLVTMDCDFTHSPEYILDFIQHSPENASSNKGAQPPCISPTSVENAGEGADLGHYLTRWFLGLPYDATGAFRLYRLDRIPRGFIDVVQSRGYSFFFESLFILHLNGFRIKELPIVLPARVYGHSKMRLRDALHSVSHLMHLFFGKLVNRERFQIAEPFVPEGSLTEQDRQGWDQYWSEKKSQSSHLVYDLIAAFYRKAIIRPALNHYVRRHFGQGAKLLHAGCGSGQVDVDVRHYADIAALDISPAALSFYRKVNGAQCRLIHGSMFAIPSGEGSYAGIYNLGVMEHFEEALIVEALKEFRRVLVPGGKVLLFWPHEYGSSVTVLKLVHFVLNRILKKNVKLHPDEITRIRNRSQARRLLDAAGFDLTEYSFGPRDFFTHAILVGTSRAGAAPLAAG
jgi:dolichol-phosphate mannosyltransferase